ncbi:MAG: TatD family hydrolase [Alphaproteobacteria bacterium]|nr:TatD family hydrolase [Alphaproteobacteria bacterium]MCB9699075.1 TatD family hydrolase [Alphaproteobacteria bacterium]
MGRDTAEDIPRGGLVDAHTHLDDAAYDPDRDRVVARARAAGVDGFAICAADPSRWRIAVDLARRYGATVFAGIHPWAVATTDDVAGALRTIPELGVDGIGELGLDRLRAADDAAWQRQREVFRAQLALARELELPVVLHCVRATPELLAICERDGLPRRGGMIHAWSGAPDQVARAQRLGLHVSFGTLVQNHRARKARESVPLVAADRLLVETDCPWGDERGEPADLLGVIEAVATLRGEDPAALGPACGRNFREMVRGR